MDTSKALVIKPKARRAIFWLIFNSSLLTLFLLGFYGLFLENGLNLFLVAYLALIAFISFEIRKNFVLLLYPKKHSLHIGPEGLFFRRTSTRILPWDEVGKVSTLSQFGKKLVKIQRLGSSPDTTDNPGIADRLRNLAKHTRARSYLIDASRLSLPADELIETIEAYAKAHNSPATTD